MTQDEIKLVQQVIGLPEAWRTEPKQPEPTRHFLSGRTFHAELKGRIEIEEYEAGWLFIHCSAGSFVVKQQILSVDGTAL